MRILMLTNTYAPHVGGVARSVERFACALRERGHQVKVVAPEAPGAESGSSSPDQDVLRVPALQNFNGSDFSVRLPIWVGFDGLLSHFAPDLLHAHHPFLLGDTAVRLASERGLPLVFTHHTLYERYTHYVGSRSAGLKRFAAQLSTEFANLCDQVVAPSESVMRLMRRRGVKAPVQVVPTGIDTTHLSPVSDAERRRLRQAWGLPPHAFVIGHVGRLAAEKNLRFMGKALASYLASDSAARIGAYALIAGQGPMEGMLRRLFDARGVLDRVRFAGVLGRAALHQAYAAMDLFAFASRTETQGMVLAEAMGAGTPVLALDAPGAREIVRDGANGMLLPRQNLDAYVYALDKFGRMAETKRAGYRRAAAETARDFTLPVMVERLEAVYAAAMKRHGEHPTRESGGLQVVMRRLQAEWKLFAAKAAAAGQAIAA